MVLPNGSRSRLRVSQVENGPASVAHAGMRPYPAVAGTWFPGLPPSRPSNGRSRPRLLRLRFGSVLRLKRSARAAANAACPAPRLASARRWANLALKKTHTHEVWEAYLRMAQISRRSRIAENFFSDKGKCVLRRFVF